MLKLQKILNKKERLVIGILSGTSVDAVDIVLVRINGKGQNSRIEVLNYKEYKIPIILKNYILKASDKNTGFVDDICRLNILIGKFYASCINKFIKKSGFSNNDIDLIGSHGQTIHHLPKSEKYLNIKYKSTLQIGDPSVIANQTGIITVGDFRTADIAVDGGGAPLVPYLDYISFRSSKTDRILLNIGGISNLTYLPKNCDFNEIIAFDTGPGNMMIDYISKKYFYKEFDKDCKISLKGELNTKLLNEILRKDNFVFTEPPKSTGRELYTEDFVEKVIRKYKNEKLENILHTFTEYTAYAISENIKRFIKPKNHFEILVSGGGANNKQIMNGLRSYLPDAEIKNVDMKGITISNKEAVLFALLANETLNGNKTNLKSVTNAKRNVILGKICLA